MKAVVTGGAGFIGSHLVRELVKKNYDVYVIDNLSTGSLDRLSDIIKKIKFFEGDIRDRNLVKKVLDGASIVFHLAALRAVLRSVEKPYEVHLVNVNGTLNILEVIRKMNNKPGFVFASSSSVYGDCKKFPQKEEFNTNPISPYAAGKLAVEKYMSVYSKLYAINQAAIRYFNVYGPGQSPKSRYAAVIPLFINLAKKSKPLPIYGSGEQSRDFCYVLDAVNATILISQNLNGFEVYNVSGGRSISILEVAELVRKYVKNVDIKFLPPRPGDVFKTQASLSKIKKFGFKNLYKFEEGLKLTIESMK
ncbi:MAG: SDR family NAD(P)-dependent oxidoreductase [bacterium]|nr:SDR family NAD(P)-dependent oxidoreductase [bacterium]